MASSAPPKRKYRMVARAEAAAATQERMLASAWRQLHYLKQRQLHYLKQLSGTCQPQLRVAALDVSTSSETAFKLVNPDDLSGLSYIGRKRGD
jgi:hypothetical protein